MFVMVALEIVNLLVSSKKIDREKYEHNRSNERVSWLVLSNQYWLIDIFGDFSGLVTRPNLTYSCKNV